MDITTIITGIVGGTLTIGEAIGLVVSFLKSKKTKTTKTATETIAAKLFGYMANAETKYASKEIYGDTRGELKKKDVLDQIKTDCVMLGIDFDEKYWTEQIETLITFSDSVNAKTTKKVTA